MKDTNKLFNEIKDKLTAKGQLFETKQVKNEDGIVFNEYAQFAESLRGFLDFGLLHEEKDWLVYEDERYTYKEVLEKSAQTGNALIASGIKKGDRVGYGGRKKASKDMRIAIVYAGYADGIPQTTIDGTKVLVNDRHAEIFGRVSMDLVSIDVTNVPNVSENDLVSFWSEELPINEFSNKNGLISYELMTKISGRVEVKIT